MGGTPFEVRDLRLKGLLLRVQPSGVMTWHVEYDRGKRASLGRADAVTAVAARERAKVVLGDAYQGRDPDPMAARRRARSQNLRTFLDEVYAPWALSHLRAGRMAVNRLRAIFPDLQNRKLGEITPWLIEKWRLARLKAGVKPATVNRDLAELKAALSRAVSWGIIDEHPIRTVRPCRVDTRATVRFLSPAEERALRDALAARDERLRSERDTANAWRKARGYPLFPDLRRAADADHLRPMVVLSLNTGIRRGELFGLTWNDVDLDRANLTVRGSGAKSGKTRHIPLNDEVLATLRDWRSRAADGVDLVFPGANGKPFDNVRKAWAGVLGDAGIERFRWHDLRHTFASKLVMAGVDLNTVRELLGHGDYQMTLRYAHLAPEHKADAVSRLLQSSGHRRTLDEKAG